MKKKLFTLTALLVMALLILALAGCNNNNDDKTPGHTHVYSEKLTYAPGAVIKEPTCTEGGLYYYVCTCGAPGTETYETSPIGHEFTAQIKDAEHFAAPATCLNGETYYYSCRLCGVISDSITFSSGARAEHKYQDNVCIYGCGDELNDYTLSDDGKYYILTLWSEKLEKVTVPSEYKGIPVKAIGGHAFASIDAKEIVLPDSVTEIQKTAFYAHDTLEKINLGKVTTIGDYAFSHCEKLNGIDLSSVTSIGDSAFSQNTSLTQVTIPENCTKIGSSAFSHCTALTEINYYAKDCEGLNYPSSAFACYEKNTLGATLFIGNKVTVIPDSLFNDAFINEIVFEDGSNGLDIGANAFRSAKGLTSLVINDVVNVGDMAFYKATITELTLGERINKIGDSAFAFCPSLTNVTINKNSGEFSEYLFYKESGELTVYYNYNGPEALDKALATASALHIEFGSNVKTIPDSFDTTGCITSISFAPGSSDVSIGKKAFYVCKPVGELDLSPVTFIDELAFGLSGPALTKLTLGADLKFIGYGAFGEVGELVFLAEECNGIDLTDESSYNRGAFSKVNTVTVGKNVKKLPSGIFMIATLGTVSFESGSVLETIESHAFFYANVDTITLPASLRIIGDSAFEHILSVSNTLNLSAVTSFGESAFRNYGGTIYLPTTAAKVIPKNAFNGSRITGTVDLSGVTTIGTYAFYYCTEITKLIFGESFKSADGGAFENCTKITEVEFLATDASDLERSIFANTSSAGESFKLTIGNKVKRIPANMFSDANVGEISFAENSICTEIAAYAFANTDRLATVDIVLPDSVRTLGKCAFVLTKASSITLGKDIEYIGLGALHSMGIIGNEEHGFIEKVYFRSDVSFAKTDANNNTETVNFLANSEENATEYAKILYSEDCTFTRTTSGA